MRQRTPLVAAAVLVALGVAAYVLVSRSRESDSIPASPRNAGIAPATEAPPAETPRTPIAAETFRDTAPPPVEPQSSAEPAPRAEIATRALDAIVEDALTAAPIEGARVTVLAERHADVGRRLPPLPGSAPLTTDARGHARVMIPRDAGFLVALRAESAGFQQARRSETGGQIVPPDAIEVRVPMFRDGVLRWPVVDGEVPRPTDGTAIAIGPELPRSSNFELATTGAIVAGMLVVEGPGRRPQRGLAKTPEGNLAQLFMPRDRDQGDPVSFRAPRTIEVRLRNRAGEPVAGWGVEARQQGNMELGPAAKTDAEGVAKLSGLYGGLADVYAGREGFPSAANRIGTIDLDKGSRAFTFVVGEAHETVVTLLRDGQPGIPKEYRVSTPGGQRGPVTEDRERGELRFELVEMRGFTRRITVTGPDFLPATGELASEPGSSRLTARLELKSGASMTVSVIPPADGKYRAQLLRWDDEAREWRMPASGSFGKAVPGKPATRAYSNLPPGRYRALDDVSNLASPVVELASDSAEITLDLSAVGVLTGRVVGPEGTDFNGCFVRCEGEGLEHRPSSPPRGDPRYLCIETLSDGRFEHRFVGGRPLRLTAVHPFLSAAADGGSLEVVPPRQDVVLRLERSTECAFRVPPIEPEALGHTLGRIPVLLFEGESDGEPAHSFLAPVRDGVARFGGHPAGRWTLWIDVPGYAPLVLRHQDLGPGVTDLGAPGFTTGSSVRVRVLTPPDLDAPRISVSAKSLDGPPHSRWTDSRGAREVILNGLGPGRYELTCSEVMQFARTQRVITCDGRSTVEIEYDAR